MIAWLIAWDVVPILVPIDPGWWLICIGPVTKRVCIWMRRAGS